MNEMMMLLGRRKRRKIMISSIAQEEPDSSPSPAPSSTSEDLFHIYDNYIHHVWEGLQRQQQEGAFCFLVLQAHCSKDSNLDIRKPHIVAHACIFANFCSKFFNVVNYDETGNYFLNLKDFTRETILTALAFLYTGIVKCSSKVLPDLRRLARHLGMEEMLIICNELIRKQKAINAAEKKELEEKKLADKLEYSYYRGKDTDIDRVSSNFNSSIKKEISATEPDSKNSPTSKANISFIDDLYHIYDGFIRRIWEGLCFQQRQHHFCNLVVCIGENLPDLHVHAAIFAIFSTRFPDLAKLDSETGKYYLSLKSFSKDAVVTLLGFFYTGVIKCRYRNVPELLELSHHLGVKESEYACKNYLKMLDHASIPSSLLSSRSAQGPIVANRIIESGLSKKASFATPSEYINEYLRVIIGLYNDGLTPSISSLENKSISFSSTTAPISTSGHIGITSVSADSDIEKPLDMKNNKFPTLSSYLEHSKTESVNLCKATKSEELSIGLKYRGSQVPTKKKKNSTAMTSINTTTAVDNGDGNNEVNDQLVKATLSNKQNNENNSHKKYNLSDLEAIAEQKLPVKHSANSRKVSLQNRKKIYRDVIYVNKEGSQIKGKKIACYTDSLPLPKRKAARPQKLTKPNNDTNSDSNMDGLNDNCEGNYRRKRRAVQCPKCPRSFADEKALLKHLNSHEQGVIHKCHVCGMNYARLCDYTRHVRVHTAENQYTCRYCNKVCQTQRDFIEHNSNEHQDNRPFKCDAPTCNFQAAKLAYLTDHRHIHSDVKGFICSKCGRTFSQAGGLHSHVKSCYQMQGYLCDLCGQTFNHLGSMKSHRRIHLGEKPHACSDCGARFSDHRNLRRHRRIHENSFPYPCTHCDKRFRHSNSLKAHLRHHGINVGGTSVTVLIQGNDCNYLDPETFPLCPSPERSELSQIPANVS